MGKLTLGSLFDGSGGFPLGAVLSGITPVWSSEIEPFAVRVTERRFPEMRHFGDISRLNGAELPPVDIITFGSPCQDMSIAGKRSGLDGERSGLFYQAIRIVKEMRCATNERYPKYIVWENVTGAFSSNKGEDFRSVLSAVCSIKDSQADIPEPEKWENAGEILADGYSVAWRTLDAQFWGVPQRRKRIYLVGDFSGYGAGKILFESEGLSSYSASGFRAWQRAASPAENRSGAASRSKGMICLNQQGSRIGITEDKTSVLRAETHSHLPCVIARGLYDNHSQDARVSGPLLVAPTVAAYYGMGGNNQPLVLGCFDIRFTSEGTKNARHNIYPTSVSRALDCGASTPDRNQGGIAVVFSTSKNSHHARADKNIAGALVASDHKDPPTAAYGISRDNKFSVAQNTQPAIVAKGPGAVACPAVFEGDIDYIVRKIMPCECAKLQGFPEWWCRGLESEDPSGEEIKRWRGIFEDFRAATGRPSKPKTDRQIIKWLKNPHSDSAEYKLWGNGVALPCVCFVLSGIMYYSQLSEK